MKQKLNKVVLGLFIAIGVLIAGNKAFAFGENGCRWNPDNPVGVCKKNTEGTWDCYAAEQDRDCTASN